MRTGSSGDADKTSDQGRRRFVGAVGLGLAGAGAGLIGLIRVSRRRR